MSTIFLSALLTGCMHGVNWVMTYIMPLKFKKYGKISFMSGLLNSLEAPFLFTRSQSSPSIAVGVLLCLCGVVLRLSEWRFALH